MADEKACGAIIFTNVGNVRKYVILCGVGAYRGDYGFPKGHMEAGETERETAIREVKEETGLDVVLFDDFRTVDEHALAREGRPNDRKTNVYFLAEYHDQEFIAQKSEVSEIVLLDYGEAMNCLQYEESRRELTEAEQYLNSRTDGGEKNVMVIRLATENDIEALQKLYYELENDAVRFQPEHFVHGARDEGFFRPILQAVNQDIIVAELDGNVVGFAHVMIQEQKRVPCLKPERVIYLQDLDVSEEMRSQGIGAKLIDACKDYGREKGADFMRTQVFPQNVRGMKFYERAGFSEKMKTIEVYL